MFIIVIQTGPNPNRGLILFSNFNGFVTSSVLLGAQTVSHRILFHPSQIRTRTTRSNMLHQGCIPKILNGFEMRKPILQILYFCSWKNSSLKGSLVNLSDGVYETKYAIILDDLYAHPNVKNAVVEITDYFVHVEQNFKVICIRQSRVLTPGSEVGPILGDPVPLNPNGTVGASIFKQKSYDISLLQLLDKYAAKYQQQIHCEVHKFDSMSSFSCQLRLGSFEVVGMGNSKDIAIASTSKDLLRKIEFQEEEDFVYGNAFLSLSYELSFRRKCSPLKYSFPEILEKINDPYPASFLRQYCAQAGLPMPVFKKAPLDGNLCRVTLECFGCQFEASHPKGFEARRIVAEQAIYHVKTLIDEPHPPPFQAAVEPGLGDIPFSVKTEISLLD